MKWWKAALAAFLILGMASACLYWIAGVLIPKASGMDLEDALLGTALTVFLVCGSGWMAFSVLRDLKLIREAQAVRGRIVFGAGMAVGIVMMLTFMAVGAIRAGEAGIGILLWLMGLGGAYAVLSVSGVQLGALLRRRRRPVRERVPVREHVPVRERVPVRSASHGRYRFRVPYPSDAAAPLTVEVWTEPCLHYLGSARSARPGRTQPAEGWLAIPADFFLWRPQEEIERSLDVLLSAAEGGRLITGTWSGQAHKALRQLLQGRDVFRMAVSAAPSLSDAVELLSFSRTVSLEGPLRDQKPYRLYVSRENDRMYLSWIGAACGTWSEWPDPEERKCVPLPADFFDRPADQIEKALRWAAEMIGYAPQDLRFRDDFAQIVKLLCSE